MHLVGGFRYFCFFENQEKRYCREVKLHPRAVMGNLDDDVEEWQGFCRNPNKKRLMMHVANKTVVSFPPPSSILLPLSPY